MGAESSVQQRDGKGPEDGAAPAASSSSSSAAETQQEERVLDSKALQKNGQISSMTSLNGHSEDNTLAEVGQPDGVSVAQKEDTSETMDTIQDEVSPQVNGEKVEKESSDANDITAVEEKAAEEKPSDANEVGFKKIFRFVGFKFTLKKDKSEEKDPVKLLTVKDKDGEEVSGTDEPVKEEEAATPEEKSTTEEKEADTEASTAEADVSKDTEKDETTDIPAEAAADAEAPEEGAKEEGEEKEEETTPPTQETTLSPFRKFFSGGLFSNLRKKASIKKTKEELEKEAAVEEEAAKTSETAVEEKEEEVTAEQETKEEAPESPVEEKSEPKEEAPASPVEEKSEDKSEAAPEAEISAETPAPAEEIKQDDQKADDNNEEEKVPAEVTSEAELLSSQEKSKPQGSPLKKLFTGAGLKKLSTKKQKAKKETEPKLTESGEQAAEQLQSSTESAEPVKADSSPSSPEESGEHVVAAEATQNESSQETEGEVTSDGEKKKEGIIAWSSFKKLVTPKKRIKRPSESEDEATGEKPGKSATLSSSESAPLADKSVEEEAKEEKPSEEEPKTENTEKLVSSTEEPKRKMDTSVSWEALMCMGGPKKRTRKTSDSDDEETKIEDDVTAAPAEAEQEGKTEAAIVTSQTTESEAEAVSSSEPQSPPERESTWDTLKRMVMPKSKSKGDEKLEDSTEQVQSDSEVPKDESSFSLRKLFPGRRKKKAEKQSSTDQGSGEEDSDTPAVVPLSEYDQQEDSEPEAMPKPPAIQIKVSAVSAEDRSPSWIPASVEDPDEKQLSDIPEEAENAATPKSIDTDIADDEAEAAFHKASGRSGRRLSTAELKPVAQAPDAATTPVPQGPSSEKAEEIVEAATAQISEIPAETSVTVQDVATEVAAEQTEPEPLTESATTVTNTILQPHAQDEAMAICTGLGTKEIAKVALEKPVLPVVEPVTVIRDALSAEMSVEEKPAAAEEAALTDDQLLLAQMDQVEASYLEAAVESSESEDTPIQVATESLEPEIEKVGAVSTAVEESELIQPPEMTENSPKAVVVSPITPICEETVCIQSVEISELTVDTKEVKMEMEQLVATEENTQVKEVIQTVTEEMTSTFHGIHSEISTISKQAESANLVSVTDDDAPVIKETVVLVAPPTAESDQADTSETVTEKESVPEPVSAEPVQVQDTKEEEAAVETEKHTTVDAHSEISDIKEQVDEQVEEIKEEVQQAGEIEAHSMVIAQSIIKDAVDKVSEKAPEEQKPDIPAATYPGETQAVSTTEKEIDTTTPVVTDTPVPLDCEMPVTTTPQLLCTAVEVVNAIPLEVTKSLVEEKEEKEEEKPKESVKEAVEVKVSEETVIVEEVVEILTESQAAEERDQVEEEESKDQKASEESQPEETEIEAPTEEKKVPEIHMPVQVVLQTAQVLEEPSVEEEAVEEFGSNGHETEDTRKSTESRSPAREGKLSVLLEEPQTAGSSEDAAPEETTDAAAETEKASSAKCAEVMAQVIEVIEEAVKEIEPVSTEITAAS